MSSLTPEDRKRIYEEELERAEARRLIGAREKKAKAKKAPGCLAFVVVIGIFFVILAAYGNYERAEQASDDEDGGSSRRHTEITALVRFTGTQFVIANLDTFDWRDCTLKTNTGVFGGGYVYDAPTLESGKTYTVGALQFAKSNGERFNPLTTKATNFTISCGEGTLTHFYYGRMD